PRPRLVGWTAGLFVLLAVLFAPVPGGLQWGPRLLLPAVPLLTVALLAAMARRRGGARGRLAVAMLAVALTAGVAVQLIGLRFLVTVRSYNASMMARVEEATPEGGVILSDDFAVPQLLAPLSVSHPMLYVPRGADLEALGARMRAAGASPLWIVKRRSRLSPEAAGEEINLGAGLLLVRRDAEDGARGYLTMPKGD
ncbi:MAG TPA: hypothetical protein VFP98_03390, partial [Candidatus Polarisedimenticolia bacterium]|nr:hypothetical protein [Candidatus Polarisedimenticolia bacterium]